MQPLMAVHAVFYIKIMINKNLVNKLLEEFIVQLFTKSTLVLLLNIL